MSVDGVQDRFTVRDVKDIINGRPGGSGTSVKKQNKIHLILFNKYNH